MFKIKIMREYCFIIRAGPCVAVAVVVDDVIIV
jgi:hypothetical protein